jgi:SAM-dependent methyltransferase
MIVEIINKIRKYGIIVFVHRVIKYIKKISGYNRWKFRHHPIYEDPMLQQLQEIEQRLTLSGVKIEELLLLPGEFEEFKSKNWFPEDYYGGHQSHVWDEKLLEHWISSELLKLMSYTEKDIFVDIAACSSPWAKILREHKNIQAFAIDMDNIGEFYENLPYYRLENATKTHFADSSVRGAALHCAYEMFMGDDDLLLIKELSRILRPGGKAIILPLYMNTHYCAYSTVEYFGKGYSDPEAKEYVRLDYYGIPSARNYDSVRLKQRVLDSIIDNKMKYKIYILRNKEDLGENIYCHFILEIIK